MGGERGRGDEYKVRKKMTRLIGQQIDIDITNKGNRGQDEEKQ